MARRALTLLAAASLAVPVPGLAARARTKAAAGAATLSGSVIIRGRIKRIRKAFNPYADIYGGGGGLKAKKAEEPGHLVVYLDGDFPPAPVSVSHAVLDQHDRQFTTDLLPVLAGTSVDFTNQDRIFHNVFSYSQPQPFDLGRRAGGETRTVVFSKLPPKGIGVLMVACEIHANMRATILVMRNPHWAVLPEAGGPFTLEGVPPGTYTLTGWHPSLTPAPLTVTLKAGETAHAELAMRGDE